MKKVILVILVAIAANSIYAQCEPMKVDVYYSKPNELSIAIQSLVDKEISILLAKERSRIDFEILFNKKSISDTVEYTLEGTDSMRVWISLPPHKAYILKEKVNPKDTYIKANINLNYRFGMINELQGLFESFSSRIRIPPYNDKIIESHMKQYPDPIVKTKLKGDSIYTKVDRKPEFPGGENALMTFLTEEAKKYYSTDSQEKIIIRIIIEKDGSISHPYIVFGSGSYFKKAALNIVNRLPKFIPGYYKGKRVRSFYDIEIRFKLI